MTLLVIDTGASADVGDVDWANDRLHKFMRETKRVYGFDTANGTAQADSGFRARIGVWDKETEVVIVARDLRQLYLQFA